MSVFGSKNTGSESYVTVDTVSRYRNDLIGEIEALKERVAKLERLAAQLSGTAPSAVAARTTGTAAALTRADAESALRELREQGANAFAELARETRAARNANAEMIGALGRKIDRLSVRQAGANSGVSESDATGVDYGAVAFGLSEIKRRVGEVLSMHSVGEGRLVQEWTDTVQYFVDVFAKSDPEFDAETFKHQSGI